MGQINYGKTMNYHGRVGNMVAYEWRGRQCVRSMPSQYRDARSEAQLSQRSLFKAVVAFAARARQVLKVGLRTASLNAQMTEYNYFMRINKGCFAIDASDADSPSLQVDFENIVLAEGPVAPVAFDAPRLLDETTIHIDYESNPLRRVAKSDDLVYLVAYCPELNDFDLSAPSYRRHKQLEMSLNQHWSGREVHLWGFVQDRDGRTSYSQYIGCGIVADADSFPPESADKDELPQNQLFSTLSHAIAEPLNDAGEPDGHTANKTDETPSHPRGSD